MCGTGAAFNHDVTFRQPTENLTTFHHIRPREHSPAVVPRFAAMGKDVEHASRGIHAGSCGKEAPADCFSNTGHTSGEKNKIVVGSKETPDHFTRCLTFGVPNGCAADDCDPRSVG